MCRISRHLHTYCHDLTRPQLKSILMKLYDPGAVCWSQVVKVQNLKARKENEIIESTIGEWETISSLVCGNHRKKNALAHLHNHLPKHNTVRCLPGPAVREKLKIRIVISAVLNSANVPASFYFLISAFFLLSSLVLFILHCARLCMEFII